MVFTVLIISVITGDSREGQTGTDASTQPITQHLEHPCTIRTHRGEEAQNL